MPLALYPIRLLHRLVGPFDGGSRPDRRKAKALSGRGVFISGFAICSALLAASHRFDDSALGAALGGAALFLGLIGGLFIGCGMGWK